MDRPEQEDGQRLREAVCERRGVGVRCHDSPHDEAARPHLRPFHTVSEGVFSEVRRSKLGRSGRGLGTWTGAMLAALVKSVTIKDTNLRRRGKPMKLEQQELDMVEVRSDLSARDLWDVEHYFRKQGVSEFIYDEPIDVFRFPEDGRFAFCETFADWERLQERGYLHF